MIPSLDGLPDTAICTERFRSVLLSFDLSAHALHARGVLLLRRSSVRNRRRRLAGLSMNPNQTTFNTAFVLYVLSCVEFFPTLHTLFFPVNFAGSLLWGIPARFLRLSRFILDFAPARRDASVANLHLVLHDLAARLHRPRRHRISIMNFCWQLFRVGRDLADS